MRIILAGNLVDFILGMQSLVHRKLQSRLTFERVTGLHQEGLISDIDVSTDSILPTNLYFSLRLFLQVYHLHSTKHVQYVDKVILLAHFNDRISLFIGLFWFQKIDINLFLSLWVIDYYVKFLVL